MTRKDRYDNKVSTQSDAALAHYNSGMEHFLAARFGAVDAFQSAIAEDPHFALAQTGLARALMMSGDMAGAKSALARAQACIQGVTEREHAHVAVFALLLSGQAAQARRAVDEHVLTYPRDAMVAQLNTSVFGLIGFSGQVGREAALLAYTSALMPHYGEDWWMMSQHAVALCETGQTTEALDLMERALALEPRNANASHFKAHSHYECGETAAGRDFLKTWLAGYDKRAVLHSHLSWHVALWSLHMGDVEEMWQALDSHIGPETGHGLPLNVLTDTASLLYRAEIAGVAVDPARWQSLSAYASKCFPETGQSFADMHAALAHAMAGNGTELARMISGAKGFAGDLIAPLVTVWRAIASQDWIGATEAILPVMAQHERLGGSRAQRDLLEFTLLQVLLKQGKSGEVRRLLTVRRPALLEDPPLATL